MKCRIQLHRVPLHAWPNGDPDDVVRYQSPDGFLKIAVTGGEWISNRHILADAGVPGWRVTLSGGTNNCGQTGRGWLLVTYEPAISFVVADMIAGLQALPQTALYAKGQPAVNFMCLMVRTAYDPHDDYVKGKRSVTKRSLLHRFERYPKALHTAFLNIMKYAEAKK